MVLNLQLFDEIDKSISPNDRMFLGDQDYYFYVGYSALNCINNALIMTEKDPATIQTILDLPSGYGRVLRWITAAFPNVEVTACDLDPDAVNFCSGQLGAKKLYSDADPDLIYCEDMFDLIWCGSLFTHLESDSWIKFLRFFDRILKPNGILLFTTHGPYVAFHLKKEYNYGLKPNQIDQIIRQYINSGFGYENYESESAFGISVAKPSSTLKLLEKNTDLQLISYQEKGWAHHQDVVGCFKDSRFSENYFLKKDLTKTLYQKMSRVNKEI